MDREKFEKIVQEVLDELPKEFINKFENIDVTIEEKPDLNTLRDLKITGRHSLLGVYRGVPLDKRSTHYSMALPDKITIFKKNIEAGCKTIKEVKQRIKKTIIHEFAHHFGITDKRLKQLGVY